MIRKSIFYIYFQTGIAPSASVKTSTTVEDKSSPSPVQNEIPEIKSVEQNSRERTISVTSAPDQAAVPEPIEVAVEADTANNNKEESSSSSQIKIHPASSSNDGSLGNDSEIQVEDSKFCLFLLYNITRCGTQIAPPHHYGGGAIWTVYSKNMCQNSTTEG